VVSFTSGRWSPLGKRLDIVAKRKIPTPAKNVIFIQPTAHHCTGWKLFCCTMQATRGGGKIKLLLILDLGTRWGWVVSVTTWPHFTPRGRTPSTHCTGGWVGPRAGLDTEARGKILCLCRESNPSRPVYSQTLSRRLGGPQSWCGHRSFRKKILCLCWLSNPDRPVYSQTLHWLSYSPAPPLYSVS
jgi:hypothetical protein